jgi:phosphonate transport system permease protein
MAGSATGTVPGTAASLEAGPSPAIAASPTSPGSATSPAPSGSSAQRQLLGKAAVFFRKRILLTLAAAVILITANVLSGGYLQFDVLSTIRDIPKSIVWMLSNFIPSLESLQKLPTILQQLLATVLISIASSCTAAVLAFVLAVLGSRSVGLGGPVPLAIRSIASLFRNIPTVAWALILLFSFKQSEFTGFLALFLGSFGYLTRCFLESIDEVSGGAVEALRATGATYGQLIAQAVIPLSATVVLSWVLYMIETNVRDATLVGILTGTGIGFIFDLYYKSFHYDQAGLVIVAIVIVVIALELSSNFIRRLII